MLRLISFPQSARNRDLPKFDITRFERRVPTFYIAHGFSTQVYWQRKRKTITVTAGAFSRVYAGYGRSINLIKPIHSPLRFGEQRSAFGKERVDRRNDPFANAKEFDFPCQLLRARAL